MRMQGSFDQLQFAVTGHSLEATGCGQPSGEVPGASRKGDNVHGSPR